jgi:alkanesulfonate monooxygenase SsuD/methylene tetrahydromethanopterin reductase-like flavin-dependent oxidoreductase (luciferase family)
MPPTSRAACLPGGPTIWLGGQKRRGIDLAARYAQGWIIPFVLPDGRTDRVPYFAERRRCSLDRMASSVATPRVRVRDPDPDRLDAGRRETLAHALGFVEVGANHVILSMPPNLGPTGVDAIASEIARPLRDALG